MVQKKCLTNGGNNYAIWREYDAVGVLRRPCCGGMLVTGSGPANAAPLTPVVSGGTTFGHPGPWGGHTPGQFN